MRHVVVDDEVAELVGRFEAMGCTIEEEPNDGFIPPGAAWLTLCWKGEVLIKVCFMPQHEDPNEVITNLLMTYERSMLRPEMARH